MHVKINLKKEKNNPKTHPRENAGVIMPLVPLNFAYTLTLCNFSISVLSLYLKFCSLGELTYLDKAPYIFALWENSLLGEASLFLLF